MFGSYALLKGGPGEHQRNLGIVGEDDIWKRIYFLDDLPISIKSPGTRIAADRKRVFPRSETLSIYSKVE